MSSQKFLVSMALVSAGAVSAIAIPHIHFTWGPSANAGTLQAPAIAETKAALPPPSPAQVADARSLSRTFSQVASQMSPSVVRISITKTMKGVTQMNPFQGTPFDRFFGDQEGGGDQQQMEGPKQHGLGSGVVIDSRGDILTNNHVVDGADKVEVTFDDGKTVVGKVVGTDPKSDLAVIKVDGVSVKPARLGDSDKMMVGEWVIAIGNPLGLDHTVTVGVLSAKNRSGLGGGTQYEDFLQTDASINPGNSGGPLVNLDGEVIGINTMIAGIGTGLGFAVPSSMAKPITEQLIDHGKVKRPYLGILMQPVTPELQKNLGKNAPEKGALVSQVQAGSPADKAGVKPSDVITDVDGKSVDGPKAVQRDVLGKKIGQKVDLAIWRDGKNQHVMPTTAELPGETDSAQAPGKAGSPKAKLGLQLQPLTPEIARELGVEGKSSGVVISGVRPNTPAAEAGVQAGDLLLEVDRHPIRSVEEAQKILTAPKEGGYLLRIKRGDGALYLVVPSN